MAHSDRRIRLHLGASRRNCCSSRVGQQSSDTSGRDASFCCVEWPCAPDGLPAFSVGFDSSFRACTAPLPARARVSCPYRTVKQKPVPAPAAERRASSSRISFPYGALAYAPAATSRPGSVRSIAPRRLIINAAVDSACLPTAPTAMCSSNASCGAKTRRHGRRYRGRRIPLFADSGGGWLFQLSACLRTSVRSDLIAMLPRMSRPNTRTVTPDGSDWTVDKPGASRASSRHDTQREAIDAARGYLGNEGGGELKSRGRMGASVLKTPSLTETIRVAPRGRRSF